jgi:hypothetical protein
MNVTNPTFRDQSAQRRHFPSRKCGILEDRSDFNLKAGRSMRRREFMSLLGGAAAWPLAARAQQRAMPVIGYISGRTADSDASMLVSFHRGLADGYRELGRYAGRILNGDKPADLPIIQPTKFELVINLKAAKALNFEIPSLVRALADEVIE